MRKEYEIDAPIIIKYSLENDGGMDYKMPLRLDATFDTSTHSCHAFESLSPAGPECMKDRIGPSAFAFQAPGTQSAEYAALRIVQHMMGCIIGRLTRLVNPAGRNVGIYANGPVPSDGTCVDVSAKHDLGVLCFSADSGELGVQVRVPVEPCPEMSEEEPFDVFLEIICKNTEDKPCPGVHAVCEAISTLKGRAMGTLAQVGNMLDDMTD